MEGHSTTVEGKRHSTFTTTAAARRAGVLPSLARQAYSLSAGGRTGHADLCGRAQYKGRRFTDVGHSDGTNPRIEPVASGGLFRARSFSKRASGFAADQPSAIQNR